MDITATTRPVHQEFIAHMQLATAWGRYNSASGRCTEKQMLRIMRQLTPADLTRMLAERGIDVLTCEPLA